MSTFGTFEAGSAAVIVCRGAVIAVGTTALSSTDLYMAGGHGKAVIVAHVVGDHLWAAGDRRMPPYKGKLGGERGGKRGCPLIRLFGGRGERGEGGCS